VRLGEELEATSIHDKAHEVTSTFNHKNICYTLEAAGLYSCGELVDVYDIEVTDSEVIGREEEE